jgi:hypothetical protein
VEYQGATNSPASTQEAAMRLSSQGRPRLSKSKRRELRLRQARKARSTRLHLRHHFDNLPSEARSFFETFTPVFRRPSFLRFALLLVATVLTVGGHTVSNVLRTIGLLAAGDPSSYHRFFSCRRWSAAGLARRLAGWIFDHLIGPGPILLAADDTVEEHRGDKVYGKGCHRDAVRSSHRFTAFRWGHKWLVLAVLVPLPFARRYWALPILIALCHTEKDDLAHGRRHKKPSQLLRQLLLVLRRWFPDRVFRCTADGGYASHELARFASRQKEQLGYVSRFYPNAGLYDPPPPPPPPGAKKPKGRPRVKGDKRDTPAQVVAKTKHRSRCTVSWYGGDNREVELVSGTGHWYQAGKGLVEVKWVYVHDRAGTHRDEYFFSTDLAMSPPEVVETYTRRWNIETTFEEMRSYMGLETTRGRKKETVLRVAPCLFGLYSVVVCLYLLTPPKYRRKPGVQWTGKQGVTFSDAITAVRKWLWAEWVFRLAGHQDSFEKLPEGFQDLILNGLAPAT